MESPVPTQQAVLFVHGMGRSPLSGIPLLWRLQSNGSRIAVFSYFACRETMGHAIERLAAKISALATDDAEIILIGHSLGGVLLRAALKRIPAHTRTPRHLFLLGSPITASCLAMKFAGNPAFRLLTGEFGQFLASTESMDRIGPPPLPTTAISGVKGFVRAISPFGDEPNDGFVSVAEVSAPWLTDHVQVPLMHTFLPSSGQVAAIVLNRLNRATDART